MHKATAKEQPTSLLRSILPLQPAATRHAADCIYACCEAERLCTPYQIAGQRVFPHPKKNEKSRSFYERN
jgi:hypothetical protein